MPIQFRIVEKYVKHHFKNFGGGGGRPHLQCSEGVSSGNHVTMSKIWLHAMETPEPFNYLSIPSIICTGQTKSNSLRFKISVFLH